MISHLGLVITLKTQKRISCFLNECGLNQWRTFRSLLLRREAEVECWTANLHFFFSPVPSSPLPFNRNRSSGSYTLPHLWLGSIRTGVSVSDSSNVGMSLTLTSQLIQVTKLCSVVVRQICSGVERSGSFDNRELYYQLGPPTDKHTHWAKTRDTRMYRRQYTIRGIASFHFGYLIWQYSSFGEPFTPRTLLYVVFCSS